MKHTIEINLNELVSLKSSDEQYDFIATLITNELNEKMINKLSIQLLDDHLGYLTDEDFKHSEKEKEIRDHFYKVINYLESL
jgi:hypothetical protein